VVSDEQREGYSDTIAERAAATAALAGFGNSARKAIDEAAAFGDQNTSDVSPRYREASIISSDWRDLKP